VPLPEPKPAAQTHTHADAHAVSDADVILKLKSEHDDSTATSTHESNAEPSMHASPTQRRVVTIADDEAQPSSGLDSSSSQYANPTPSTDPPADPPAGVLKAAVPPKDSAGDRTPIHNSM
jgi:hypothetical protein